MTADFGGIPVAVPPPEVADGVLQELARMAGSQGFAGGNPVSIERRHLSALNSEPYVICPKTDGTRALLVCAVVGPDDKMVVALVNRAMQVFIPTFGAVNRAAFQGSIFDIEVVKNQSTGAMDMLVFDAVCVCGVPVAALALRDRLAAVSYALGTWQQCAVDCARLSVKPFYDTAADLHRAEAQGIPYANDGLILTPTNRPNSFGRNQALFKWKDHHTIDFLVDRDGRTLLVYDMASGAHRAVGHLDTRQTAQPGVVAECAVADQSAGTWTLVKTRTDKARANDLITFERTLVNIHENIQRQEILAWF